MSHDAETANTGDGEGTSSHNNTQYLVHRVIFLEALLRVHINKYVLYMYNTVYIHNIAQYTSIINALYTAALYVAEVHACCKQQHCTVHMNHWVKESPSLPSPSRSAPPVSPSTRPQQA